MQSSDEVKSYLPFGSAATEDARQKRLAYLAGLGHKLESYGQSRIPSLDIKSNIESFIGTMSIPVGLVGPLLFNDGDSSEKVFAPAATTEGALVASMNRGAKVISECGGFRAHIVKQMMSRAPIFCFKNLEQSIKFESWLLSRQGNLAVHIKHFSKHAELIEIKTKVLGRHVEAKFCYHTGDASGQNMTTICTWQSCKWILKHFKLEKEIEVLDFVLEGNGASDKKASYDTLINGRGTEVIGECFISEETLKRRLKVSTKEIMKWYNIARPVISQNGMMGDNINVANAIAAIFTATGQDIACIQESAIGFLNFEETENGIYMSLRLPKLVIGTIGGGTSLPSQKDNLEIMKCAGANKVERFAKLICGFAMGLELSTISAMVSGQFAMAHERLGRNKPVKFLKNDQYLTKFMQENLIENSEIDYLEYKDHLNDSNGIITELTASNTEKFIGMSIWNIHGPNTAELALLKSKPTSQETLNCMYILTGMIAPDLAKEFEKYKFESDFSNCHLKEIEIYRELKNHKSSSIPMIYNEFMDQDREIYLILMEFLNKQNLKIFNSEMDSSLWTVQDIKLVLKEHYKSLAMLKSIETNDLFKPRSSKTSGFYQKSFDVIKEEYGSEFQELYMVYKKAFNMVSKESTYSYECIIHNDFNPRNIAITKEDRVITYDWELARLGSPARDFIELFSFLIDNEDILIEWDNLNKVALEYLNEFHGHHYSQTEWETDLKQAFSWFIIERVSLYLVGNKLTEYEFVPKLTRNIITLSKKIGL